MQMQITGKVWKPGKPGNNGDWVMSEVCIQIPDNLVEWNFEILEDLPVSGTEVAG